MKVAIVCYPTFGGSGVVASELAMEVASRGHCVHVLSYQLPVRLDPLKRNVFFHQVETSNYPVFHYPPYMLALATKLVEVVRAHGARIVHLHYAIPHTASAILARLMCEECGIRIITTLHGTDITLVGAEPSYFEITRFAIEASDGVTAVSEYLADATYRRFRVKNEIRVIPNFVDVERYRPERRDPALRTRYAEPEEKLLVHVSNFREVKRVVDVVRVFARVARRLPARLLMVGTGPDRVQAEEELARLGLAERASFVGPVGEVPELIAIGDLFILPSLSESFGLAALESLASGVPVIATRTGGLPELIEDGVSGVLAEVAAVDEMGERAIELLSDPVRHRAMALAGRERAMARFPRGETVGRYIAYYEEVAARAR